MLALTTMSEISHKAIVLLQKTWNTWIVYICMVHFCHFRSFTALSKSLLLWKRFSLQSHLDFCVPYTIDNELTWKWQNIHISLFFTFHYFAFDVFPVDISRIVKLHYKLIDNKFLKKMMITFLLAEIPLFFCNSYFGCYVCSFFFSLSIQCLFVF